jgi:hypothetical protein
MKKCYRESRRRGILYVVITGRKAVIGHILCRNFLVKHVIEGKIEVKGR